MTTLKRDITLYGLTMVAIGSCIGSGIFLTPSQIAAQLRSPALILVVWALGGLITLTGALTFAELGGMFPQAGGVYVYLKEAYGPLFGFLYGWAYLLVICSGAIAALCIAFATYLDFLIPLGAGGKIIVAVLAVLCLTAVNIVRVKAAEMFATIFTGLKLLSVAAIVVAGLFWGTARPFAVSPGVEMPINMVTAFGLALIGVLWSYGGWQHATYLAGETQNPQRSVPRAMVIGGIVVTAAYLCINLAYLYLLPMNRMVASGSVAADALETILPFAGGLVAAIIAVSVIGTAGIYTLSAPRIYYAMANDGVFFKGLAKVHERFRTPVNAILFQSAWAILLILFWGTFEDVITYVVFTDWIFFGLTAYAIFIFRTKRKDAPRPYKTPWYPVTPIIFIGITIVFVINTLLERPKHAWAGLIFMAAGTVVFYFFKVRPRTQRRQP
jgi:APA family basic amino acid/polyamine antiporter